MPELTDGRPTDEERIIPWAEGNGTWKAIADIVADLRGVDLVTFFVQNPNTVDIAAFLGERIGRKEDQIQPVLTALAAAGFLHLTVLGDLRVYHLTDDVQRRQTLQQYVMWLQEGYHWARMAMDRP